MEKTQLQEYVHTFEPALSKEAVTERIKQRLESSGYDVVEVETQKPWGAYLRIEGAQADAFVEEFFEGLSPTEARRGNPDAELSPKILIVAPGERLSWQYHYRRAERWKFLTEGSYNKSMTDEPGDARRAVSGDVVQFDKSERHRLNGLASGYVIVAEIWQHVDAENPSDEADIVRLIDDYKR